MSHDALLVDILAELRALRAEVRKGATNRTGAALLAAIEEYFGPGRFTVAGLLELAAEAPNGQIAEAVGAIVNMNADPRARATALGMRLARMAEVKEIARANGSAVYCLRTFAD